MAQIIEFEVKQSENKFYGSKCSNLKFWISGRKIFHFLISPDMGNPKLARKFHDHHLIFGELTRNVFVDLKETDTVTTEKVSLIKDLFSIQSVSQLKKYELLLAFLFLPFPSFFHFQHCFQLLLACSVVFIFCSSKKKSIIKKFFVCPMKWKNKKSDRFAELFFSIIFWKNELKTAQYYAKKLNFEIIKKNFLTKKKHTWN